MPAGQDIHEELVKPLLKLYWPTWHEKGSLQSAEEVDSAGER